MSKKINLLIFYLVLLTGLSLSSCMEETGFTILWDGLEVEFDGASRPNGAVRNIVTRTGNNQVDQASLRINLVGAHLDTPVDLVIGVDTSSTAIPNVHYRLITTSVTIPAKSSFVQFPIEILTSNLNTDEAPDLVLNILDAGNVKISVNYRQLKVEIRLACPSDLAGVYNTVNVGTGGTINSQVTITEVEPFVYRISDLTGGYYASFSNGEDNPGIFNELCGVITIVEQPDTVFGRGPFNGTGRVNSDGTIRITWSNEEGDSGVTTLTRV